MTMVPRSMAIPRATGQVSGAAGELLRFTRLAEWHPGKLPLALGIALTLALTQPDGDRSVAWIVVFYLLTTLYLAGAYTLNNVADFEADRSVGKTAGLDTWSHRARSTLAWLVTAASAVPGALVLRGAALIALAGCFALSYVYSRPPRLKEHIVLGPLVAAFAQVPAPALTFSLAWGGLPPAALAYCFVTFLYGLRMILLHQLLDLSNDLRTGTRTTAVAMGAHAIRRLLRITFVVEALGTATLVVLLVTAGLPRALLVVLLWPLALCLIRELRGESPRALDNYRYIPLADVHESVLPLLVAIAVAARDGGFYLILVPILFLLFFDRHVERLFRPVLRREAA